MAGRPYLLAETNWAAVRGSAYDVAILPWGSTEAHNYHLPYGTDTIETERVAAEAARVAWEAGARVIVLPCVPFGVQNGQLDIPLCLHVNPSTQFALLADLATTLEGQGIRKLVILNGHGGNDFKAIIRELQPQLDIFLCTLNWFAAVDPKPYFDVVGDHAGEMETSNMMHLTPDLVLPLEQAGDGEETRFRVRAMREGWVWAPREWRQISQDTGVGDPRAATAAKGERYLRDVCDRIGGFLVEFANADLGEMYG